MRLAPTDQAEDLELLDADGKAEADAIPVPEMDRLLTDAIETLQDPACRERLLAEERDERERLPEGDPRRARRGRVMLGRCDQLARLEDELAELEDAQ